MTATRFDHVALPTNDGERFGLFYASLGFALEGFDQWRAGEHPAFAIVFGDNKINVHPETMTPRRGEPWYLRAPTAEAGSADLCFVWEGEVARLLDLLGQLSIPVVAGPVERVGGRNQGTSRGISVYIRDPDDNLLEFISYPG